ncbi:MAG: ribosome biogenesis GTPase Der [Rickettsiales bacterium]|jgi:GTP-binding protein|nr:ribosome biogenesis GTPase Der [Rickettsiales bacterium]
MKVAIAGRPNTGKSTLFNALTGTRGALVHNRPGVTRDVLTGVGNLGDLTFDLMDTAGLEDRATELEKQSTEFALDAVRSADAVLFVVDGRTGVTADDIEWARRIRRARGGAQTLLVANKTESSKKINDLSDFYKLGFGAPATISAEHKIGFDRIYDFLEPLRDEKIATETDKNARMRLTIMGQPNVGKSTLVNKILGRPRVIVRDQPGVTRDTIEIPAKYLNRDIIINDTAGLRRKSNITDGLETLSALKSLDALNKTDAVILVVDATRDIEKQALGIASRIYDAGKVLCIALNKWDLVEEIEREDKLLKLKHQFKKSFHQIIKPMILPMSAENGMGVRNLMRRVFDLYDKSQNRVSTALLNRTMEKLIEARQPPMSRLKRPMKIKFVTQVSTSPIRITINVGGASDIPESYTRYLRRGLAMALDWEQLPIFIEYKKTENPYD